MPKTIFGTTEKSNFILNMKTETYHKWNLYILIAYLILMPMLCIPLEFARVYSLPGIAMAVTGVAALVFSFIGYMKSATPKSMILPTVLAGGMAVWAIVSMYNAFNQSIATFGADGRSEGALTVLFYGCFFLLGAQLGAEKNRLTLLYAALWMGLAECAWALLQMLPIGFPSYYKNLEPMLLFRVFLPSGLTGSPIFLATLLIMQIFPAFMGACYAGEKKHRILCTVSTAVFLFTAAKTQCLLGLAGGGAALLAALICILVRRNGSKVFLRAGIAAAAFVLGIGLAAAAPVMNGSYSRTTGKDVAVSAGFRLYDGAIMWEDSSYRLATSGYYNSSETENPYGVCDIADMKDVYLTHWRTGAAIAGKYPLVGTGPDNLIYAQFYRSLRVNVNLNTFDRVYNHYLHLAATMGIPALLLFLALMGITVVRGAKSAKGSWVQAALLGAVVLYLLSMIFGASSITVAPFFWALAGCCAGEKSSQ